VKVLFEGSHSLGLTLTSKEIDAFRIYQRELAEWNTRFNLTAVHGETQVQIRHFLDSLSCLLAMGRDGPFILPSGEAGKRIPKSVRNLKLRVIDIGSGPGFPGIPLKIVCPRLKLTLLEATGKKVTFLQHIVDLLRLEDVQVIHDRAETTGQSPEHRESYDLVLARAVAELAVLAEYALPFCSLGGQVIAQKGQDAQVEAMSAERVITLLGGTLSYMLNVEIPGLAESRSLVVIGKTARTPVDYPRRAGIPNKKPL
jgi:16S rRNA (guanine527-N7)-methyltransferase